MGRALRITSLVVLAIVTGAASGRAQPLPSPTPAGPSLDLLGRLRLQPTWDDGFRYELHRAHDSPLPPAWRLFPGDTFISGRAGGRLHVDAAAFATTGHIDGIDADVGVRRAFFNTEGDIALRWPIHFRFEAGIRSEEPYLNALWFEHRRPSGLGVTVGQLDAPLSRERLTSSNAITFLERASPVRAFAPGTKTGVQLSYGSDDVPVAGALGVFGDARHPDGAHTTNGAPRLIGRLIWAPPGLTDPANGRVLALGVAGEYVLKRSTTLNYKSTPESWLALPVVDTGKLQADHAFLPGLELAIQRGTAVLEAEALGAVVDLDDHGPELFWGGYAALGTMLTGETRPYDRRRGTFGMPTPHTPFSLREGRWRGAWEIAGRYAYLDLDAPGVAGGRIHTLTLGLNWYWNRHVRLMFDYGATFLVGDKPDGTAHVFESRLQLVY